VDVAITKITDQINRDPENPMLYIDRGWNYLITNRKPEAIKDFKEVIKLGLQPDVEKWKVFDEGELEDWEDSKIEYDQLIELIYKRRIDELSRKIEQDKFYHNSLIIRACLHCKLGDVDKALFDFENLIALEIPKGRYQYVTGGNISELIEQTEDIKQELSLGVLIELNLCESITYKAYRKRAGIYVTHIKETTDKIKRETDSLDQLGECWDSREEIANRIYNQEEPYSFRKDQNVRIEEDEELLKLHNNKLLSDYSAIIDLGLRCLYNDLGSVYLNRGMIHFEAGRYEDAISDFHEVKAKNEIIIEKLAGKKQPKTSKIWLSTFINEVLAKIGISRCGVTLLCRLENALAYGMCCSIHCKQDKQASAERDLEKAVNEFDMLFQLDTPDKTPFYLLRGHVYLLADKEDLAQKDFFEAIESSWNIVLLATIVGEIYLTAGIDRKAYDLYMDIAERIIDESIDNEKFINGVYDPKLFSTDSNIELLCNSFFGLAQIQEKIHKYKHAINLYKSVSTLCTIRLQVHQEIDREKYQNIAERKISEIHNDAKKQKSLLEELEKSNKELELINKKLVMTNEELKEKSLQLKKANEELENTMAMFAHKFKGPLQIITWNVDRKNEKRISQEAVKTMSGLLEIFSTVSTSSAKLQQKLINDKSGDGTILNTVSKSLALAISQLLSESNSHKIRQHYISFAKKNKLVPDMITVKDWKEEWHELESNLQKTWEDEFMALVSNPNLELMLNWIERHFCKIEIRGIKELKHKFLSHGPKESVLMVFFVELILNAIKYYYSEGNEPIIISWVAGKDASEFNIQNPSAEHERDIDKGDGKGHDFLRLISENLGHTMPSLLYGKNMVVRFPINNELLI